MYTKIHNFDDLAKAYSKAVDRFFFIQVGANDGRIGDPLFQLVREFNWGGILIEPQRSVFEKHLLPNYDRRDNLFFENVAIAEEDGVRELFKLSFSEKRWATGLASFKKSHLERHIDNGYVELNIGDERAKLPEQKAEYLTSETVTTMTFDTLLDKHRIKRLDLLQMDTEGYDYQILRLFDFKRIKPGIIQLEHHVMSKAEKSDSLDFLANQGYVTFENGINLVGTQQPLVDFLGLRFDVDGLRVP